ncbi:MAG: hypothetical protein H6861_09640 [Rhodospirillales bacterium]|nr:hypothetical protein [Rhodospirillales bacterium]
MRNKDKTVNTLPVIERKERHISLSTCIFSGFSGAGRLVLCLFFSVLVLIGGTTVSYAGAGDPCTIADKIYEVESPSGPALICNGTTLQVLESAKGSPVAKGIGTDDPKAPLHVGGEAIIGVTTGLACDADREGGLRWSAADSTFEMCDGASWRLIAASSSASDCTPDAFTFTDVTEQPLSSVVASNIVTITGIDGDCPAFVSGSGSPQISVNSGAWLTSTTISPGDTLQVRMTTSASVNTAQIASVTVGTVSDDWSVTTKLSGTRIFRTTNTYRGDSLGGIGGAHTICQNEAGVLGYGGLFRALLSNEFIDAVDMLSIAYPVTRASDATTVDATNIWDGSLAAGVHTSSGAVWTGSNSDGTVYNTSHCNNWRAGGSLGLRGVGNNATSQWIYSSTADCTSSCYLYCVEQASAIGPILGITPGSYVGFLVEGTGSPAYGDTVSFTVENAGDQTSDTMTTALTNTTNFEFVSDTCNGNTLAQGATCTVQIRPKATLPGGEGALSGSLTVTANNNPSASLSGYAQAAITKIFKTANSYRGDSLGGLSGADTLCQTEAGVLGYSGTWKALLSDSTTNAKDRLTITYPVVRAADGTIVDSTNLWDGTVQTAIEPGSYLNAWTGSNTNGTASSSHCTNWSATGGIATYGRAEFTNTNWINIGTSGCAVAVALYCVKQ